MVKLCIKTITTISCFELNEFECVKTATCANSKSQFAVLSQQNEHPPLGIEPARSIQECAVDRKLSGGAGIATHHVKYIK